MRVSLMMGIYVPIKRSYFASHLKSRQDCLLFEMHTQRAKEGVFTGFDGTVRLLSSDHALRHLGVAIVECVDRLGQCLGSFLCDGVFEGESHVSVHQRMKSF